MRRRVFLKKFLLEVLRDLGRFLKTASVFLLAGICAVVLAGLAGLGLSWVVALIQANMTVIKWVGLILFIPIIVLIVISYIGSVFLQNT